MASPIRTFEHSQEETIATINIYLKRIREEEEERTERKKEDPSANLETYDEAVLNAKIGYLKFLHERGMSKEEQDFLRLPINDDAKKVWEAESSQAAAA
jgi:hypothetical protein